MLMFSLDDRGDVLTSLEDLEELVSFEVLALPASPELFEDLEDRTALLSLDDLGELTVSLEDLEVLPVALDDLDVLTVSREGLEVLTASLDLELLLLFTLVPESILLELPLFTELSLLDVFGLLSECVLA